MATVNRRDVIAAAGAFAALGAMMAGAQPMQADGEQQTQSLPMGDAALAQSRVFRFSQMPVTNNANGGWGRQVLHGTLPTGEYVECHETMLPAGKMPHPPHKHRNTEFVLIREGKLEFLDNGKPEPVGPGDVIFTASNVMHGLRNVGDTPALYFVVSVSRQDTVG
jgi:quercetin dioxygenase-like cupin family protein